MKPGKVCFCLRLQPKNMSCLFGVLGMETMRKTQYLTALVVAATGLSALAADQASPVAVRYSPAR